MFDVENFANNQGLKLHLVSPTCEQNGVGKDTLVLFFGWLGAKEKSLDRYFTLYEGKGFIILYIPGDVWNFLWYPTCKTFVEKLLNLLLHDKRLSRYDNYLIHSMSIGSYVFSQCVSIARRNNLYSPFLRKVKGIVFDSITYGSFDYMQRGVAAGIFQNKCMKRLLLSSLPVFFRVFKQQTVDVFEVVMKEVELLPLFVPTILLYCKTDPMCEWTVVQNMAQHWRTLGLPLINKCWEESAHVSHLKLHFSEYVDLWQKFINMFSDEKHKAAKSNLSKL